MKNSRLFFAFAALTVIASSCTEERIDSPSNEVRFNIGTSSVETKSAQNIANVLDVQSLPIPGKNLFLSTTVSENTSNPLDFDFVATKGDKVLVDADIVSKKSFGVDVISGAGTVEGNAVLVDYENYWHLQANGAPQHWGSEVAGKADFWAYFNTTSVPTLETDGLSLAGLTNGEDVLFANATATESENGAIGINFHHALAAINIINGVGDVVRINSVSIGNVVKSGNLIYKGGDDFDHLFEWSVSTDTEDITQDFSDNYFLIIPQALKDKKITLTINVTVDGNDYVLTHNFDEATYSWVSGKLYTYTITGANGTVAIDTEVDENNVVSITNVGTTAAYVRAVYVGNIFEGERVVSSWTGSCTVADGWAQDGFYYHQDAVLPGETVSFVSAVTNASAGLKLNVAVQAVEADSNKSYAETAWGSKVSNLN